MTEYVTFEAEIEPMQWGDTIYTVLRLPPDIQRALPDAKRLEGEFNDHPVNLAVARAPVIEDPFLWTGKSLLSRVGLEPGTRFEARLRVADPDAVDVPPDVTTALRAAGVSERWEALSPGKRRGLLHGIEQAKRADTRSRRIGKLVEALT